MGISLIVGLGNPGRRYYYHRHNIGFRVIDRLASEHNIDLNHERFQALYGRGNICGRDVVLMKPMAYMNLSGPPTRGVGKYFKMDASNLLVVHDDMDFPFGRIKFKEKGGNAGHKGIQSMIDTWGTGSFYRIRIGIGRPDTKEDVTDYVLGRFDYEQEVALDAVISAAQKVVEEIVQSNNADCKK
ncbi:MAG: aminoacyl-tRNA hydrolase [Pseudomonadota bacterium]